MLDLARAFPDPTGATHVGALALEPLPDRFTGTEGIANLLTLLGFGAAIIWLAGGSWVWAFVSIVADEADGSIARAIGETSDYGADLDRTIDLVLTGAVAMKLGPAGLAALVPIVMVQAATKDDQVKFGSWRAVLMGAAVASGRGGYR